VRAVAFAPTGDLLAAAGADGKLTLWELPLGRQIPFAELPACVTNVAFSPDGKTLAAITDAPDAAVRVWDVAGGRLKAELRGHATHVVGLAYHPGGHLLATSARDGTLRLWAWARARAWTAWLGPPGGRYHSAAFSPDGRHVAAGTDGGRVLLFRVPQPGPVYDPGPARTPADPAELAQRPSPADSLRREAIPPELLDKAAGGKPESLPELVAILGGAEGQGQLIAIAISPDGTTLASAGNDHTVKLWNLSSGRLLHDLDATDHGSQVRTVAFSPDGQRLASAGSSGGIALWDVSTGAREHLFPGRALVERLAFDADGARLVAARQDGFLEVWDLAARKLIRALPHPVRRVGIGFSPEGGWLLSSGASADPRAFVQDIASGWEIALPAGHASDALVLALHPAGRTLATAGNDKTLRLWDLKTLREKEVLRGHGEGVEGGINGLDWRRDGLLLASAGGKDGTIRLWDFSQGATRCKTLRMFVPDGVGHLHAVAFTPEGRHLATANPDGTVYVLRLAERGTTYRIPAQ
jgi:WD40 repeat protein